MYNSFGELHDRRWLERQKHLYANPKEYKEHLKQQSDKDWEKAKTGGINEEMSIALARDTKEEIRKEEAKKKKEEEANKVGTQSKIALGPNFPKVWDLNYFREDTQKIFKKLSNDKLDWDFFDFPIWI